MSLNPLFAVMANVQVKNNSPASPDLSMDRDNLLTPGDIQPMFLRMYIETNRYKLTELMLKFTSKENIELVRQRIEVILQQELEDDAIVFVLSREFYTAVCSMIELNLGANYEFELLLQALNEVLIKTEAERAILSQRQWDRYNKWILQKQYPKVMHYGFGDRTYHIRGENQQDPSGYALNHPHKSQYADYMQSVMGIDVRKGLSK